jgi:short-subunit dehydrogenase
MYDVWQGCRGVIETAVAKLGGVDVLILNHIIGYYDDWGARIMRGHAEGTLEKDLTLVDQMMAINTLSYIYLSAYALPELAKAGGKIIAVGSAAGKQGLPRVAPYAATKHAVFGYFDSLRHDLVMSHNASLARVTVTTGVLGSFDTETAREGTGGKLDALVTWSPPAVAASALLKAGARRWRTVYVPWEQTRIITLLHPLMPALMDWVIQKIMVPE